METYFFSSELMTNRDVNEDFVQCCAIVQRHCKTITNASLFWVVVIQCDLWILDTVHLCPKSVNAGVFSDVILVVFRSQTSKDQWYGNL